MAGPALLAAGIYLRLSALTPRVYGLSVSAWLIGLGLLALAGGLALYVVGQPRPLVTLNGPNAFHVQPVRFSLRPPIWGRQEVVDVSVLFVRVINRSRRPSTRSATARVSAHFRVEGPGTAHLPSLDGRWAETPPPRPGELGQLTIDLDVDSGRQVVLLVKEPPSQDCFLFNNDSYRFVQERLQNPAWRIGPGRYMVRVRVSGENVGKLFACEFENPGAGEELRVISFGEE